MTDIKPQISEAQRRINTGGKNKPTKIENPKAEESDEHN